MKDWCMQHPVLTVIVIFIVCGSISNIMGN